MLARRGRSTASDKRSPFPKRIAHTAMSFVSLIFSHSNDDELRGSTATRRFEWFAKGASEFLRYVELGGTPCGYMFFDPLIHHLLTGKGTKYCFVSRGQHLSLLLQPFSTQEHGMEGNLIFLLDANAPENNFLLTLQLWLSESTDIDGVAIRDCETWTVKAKLTQVPTQDLSWVSDSCSVFGCYDEQQINLHTICSKWFRLNPLCCQQQDQNYSQRYNATSSSSESLPCDIYMEPVTQVYLLGHVTLSVGNNRQRAVVNGESKTSPKREFPYMKLGAHFCPHASSEDLSPAVNGSATEMIYGVVVQSGMHAKISFEQLGGILIPKAVDCLRRDVAATSYQIMWKSKHGRAYFRLGRPHGEQLLKKTEVENTINDMR
jgi:hypothetical protein